jgi:eukaryotic-like serine/threonine-protein kinase
MIGGFRLSGRIGEGGQGVVYLGKERNTDERVALKLLHGTLGSDQGARERFMREAELGMQVASFCTARILSAGMVDDRPYIVSEYIDGPCLKSRVDTEGVLSGGALDRLAIGTATALTAIHQAGIVHRDFKPANVLLGPDGPRVIDFGIALSLDSTLTATNHVVGTPAYMAPERFSGARIGPAADIFSWGATIAFAATGRAPFGTDAIPAVLNRVLNGEPDLAGLTRPLRDLVERCLAKDPARRPSAQEVLLGLLGGKPASNSGPQQTAMLPEPVLTAATGLAAATTNPRGGRSFQMPGLSRRRAYRVLLPAAGLVALAATLLAAAQSNGDGALARADASGKSSTAPELGWPSSAPASTAAQVRVPNVLTLAKSDAVSKLRAAGLDVGDVTTDCTAKNSGTVVSTSPVVGTGAAKRSDVDLVVAGEEKTVLDGKGWPVGQARKVLEKNGFKVKVTKQQSSYWHGKVFTQQPAAGTRACPGTVVTLRVGTS